MKIHESLAAVHTSIFNEIIKKLYKIEKGGLYLYASRHKKAKTSLLAFQKKKNMETGEK